MESAASVFEEPTESIHYALIAGVDFVIKLISDDPPYPNNYLIEQCISELRKDRIKLPIEIPLSLLGVLY